MKASDRKDEEEDANKERGQSFSNDHLKGGGGGERNERR